MIADQLRDRTRQFALDVVDLCLALPTDDLGRLVRPQLLRAGTGVASNYRASQRSRSRKEFIGRIAVAIEEADEAELWMDVLQHRASEPAAKVTKLRTEASELRAIFAKSRSTAIANAKRWPA
ncbi:MAG TPA: four helix bundle protein [Vicinamibacterales bacterium]|nr:four helix bundle protein [Vicinamibacterales bacterium]